MNNLVILEEKLTINKNIYYRFILDNINCFSKTSKYKNKRPVWFFKGTNNKAKNYIASKTNISKYIIDKYNFIPDLIECDIIVFPDNKIEDKIDSNALFFNNILSTSASVIENTMNLSKRNEDKELFFDTLVKENTEQSKNILSNNIFFGVNTKEKKDTTPKHIKVKQDIIITDELIKLKCIGNNEYISVSFESKVNKNIRYPFRKRRYVYIFIGEPNIGKSYIGNSLGLSIFETDNNPILPNYIEEDIVIIGKNRIFDIDLDIIPRFKGNCHFTYVEFNYIS